MSWAVGRRYGSDLALLWLWCRPAAVAPIEPLAWEPSYAMGVAIKRKGKKKKDKLKTELLYKIAIQLLSIFVPPKNKNTNLKR